MRGWDLLTDTQVEGWGLCSVPAACPHLSCICGECPTHFRPLPGAGSATHAKVFMRFVLAGGLLGGLPLEHWTRRRPWGPQGAVRTDLGLLTVRGGVIRGAFFPKGTPEGWRCSESNLCFFNRKLRNIHRISFCGIKCSVPPSMLFTFINLFKSYDILLP